MDNEAYVRAVHDRGLRFDLRTMNRRRMLGLVGGGAGAVLVAGCSPSSGSSSSGSSSSGSSSSTAATDTADETLEEIESETAGPYPADGSNGPNVRTQSGIVRKDIRSSFGTSGTIAAGVPLTFSLTIKDLSGSPLSAAAVYAWHCDQAGRYSLYSDGVTGENYLRGIQATDASGTVSFSSIYPACYSGRWPHIHFEVYASVDHATSGDGPIVKTSQIALPEDVSKVVYAADGYSASVGNLGRVSLSSDMVFGDDSAARELATVTGSVAAGYQASLTLAVTPS
jgi:protocatechuate 3,4-dioxygenase beta subunit